MSNNLISIIIPCYNQAQYLPETLQSVLNQTYKNWECVIVNDGSPDNTEEIATKWQNKDSRFIYLKKENGGLADARNYGIKASKGKYILPLDSDDLIATTYIEKAIKILDENDNIGVVYSKANFFGNRKGKWKIPKHSIKRSLLFNTIFCSAVFRHSDFAKTNGYNTNMLYGYEDWDFWLSLFETGAIVYRIDEPLFLYRIHSKSMVRSFNLEKLTFLHSQLINNHLELYQKHFSNPFLMVRYFKFREGMTGSALKRIFYLFKKFDIEIYLFYLKIKLYHYLIS